MDYGIAIGCRYRCLKTNGVLNMKQLIKKLFGIKEPYVRTAEEEERIKAIAEAAAEESKRIAEEKRIAGLTPKELATEKREPWVAVLDTHVNKDNIRNGFFELDWNEYFVLQLRAEGYTGDTDEAIVDQWFMELCRNVGGEEGVDMSRRGAGYVNRALRDDGKTEIF
jgi:hypothetical protein